MKNNNSLGCLDFFGIVGLVVLVTVFASLAIFFAMFVYAFTATRWLTLNTFFRCKIYLPCYGGYYNYDVSYKLNWLKKHYRWRHIVEQDVVQIQEYPHYYGPTEYQTSCIRGVTVRFLRKSHAVHFKLVCHDMENMLP